MLLLVILSVTVPLQGMQTRYIIPDTERVRTHFNMTTQQCFLKTAEVPQCTNQRYPSIDGKCNNKINPFAGVVATPLKRLIQPEYGDGLSAPRRSVSGGELPNPRMISNALNDTKTASRHVNAMFVTFGQFITHDLVLTPETKEVNGVEVNCSCSNPHPSCVNIPVPRGDPLHATTTCIPMKGTKVVHGCGNYPAENINLLPSYIDGNMIYGSSEEMLQTLRDQSSESGQLRMLVEGIPSSGCPMRRQFASLLTRKNVPSNISRIITCPGHLNPPGSTCFVSGERRLNENIGLSSLHLLFSREHNRIARRLNFLNRNWDSDTVFFETRRIIVAMIQVITYNEFLPLLLGRSYAKRFGLDLLTQGNYFGYNPTFDAGVSSAFATAAFRYGHTQVGASFSRLASDYIRSEFPTVPMRKALFQQAAVVNGSSHSILRGMMEDPALEVAPNMVDDLKNHMFESSSQPGKDLLAINIHRGRLHGLPGYNKYREFCGLNRARNWSDLASTINESMVTQLSVIYSHVDDIDLMIGGIAETPLSAGSVGPTFGCIIAHQFRDVRKGDRFWFENPGIFSIGQLQELRKASLSRVICDNMENMTTISPYAMLLSTVDSNSRINCENIEPLNLALWKVTSDHLQDGEWTRWFPTEDVEPVIVLQKLLATTPDCICTNPIDQQREVISESTPNLFRLRFLCPKGTLNNVDFPNTKTSLHHYWTEWFDRDTPSQNYSDDVETLEFLRLERPNKICPRPLYIQAQTKHQVSALISNQVFESLDPTMGLVCRGKHQRNGKCQDYRVRFCCPNVYKHAVLEASHRLIGNTSIFMPNIWTPWVSLSSPYVSMKDTETLGLARARGFAVCRQPIAIDARTVGSHIVVEQSGDILKRYSVFHGLICDNRDQTDGQCSDYEVRYLCSYSSIHRTHLN